MIYIKPKKYTVILGLDQYAPGPASAAAASEVPWQCHQCHSHWVPEFEKILQRGGVGMGGRDVGGCCRNEG